ncbi:winged helix-turn-helix transcriptional regulator [Mycobacterium seoulense]|nr:winged helix-turn-helix transcriptional regulator [Mycobacterium seoulense]
MVALLDLARDASVQTLSALIGISHSGTVRLVDRLADADLVERRTGSDARTNSLRLTRRGRTVALRLRASRRAAIAAALEGLTDRQRRQLNEICQTVIANITRARLRIRAAGGQPSGGALCRLCDPSACGRPDGQCPAAAVASHEANAESSSSTNY